MSMNNEEIRDKAISGAVWKFLERVIAQAISLIVSVVIARLLDPSDYGVVSIVAIFFSFANVIISGGLNTALIQKKKIEKEDYSTVLILSVSLAIIIYIILFFSAPAIAWIYQKEILVNVFRVMGLVLPIMAVKSIVCAYISVSLQFKKFFFATIVGTIISGIAGIICALHGMGPWALVIQQMTNTFIDTLILLAVTKMKLPLSFSFFRFKSLFKYGSNIFIASIVSVIYDEAMPLVVGIKYSSSDLSFYQKGKSFPNLLYGTLGNTLSAVLFPVMSKYQDNKDSLLNLTRRFMRICSYVVFPVMIGFFAVSDNFIVVLLSNKWAPAATFIKIFSVSYMFDILCTGNLQTIKAIGRSDIVLKLEILKKSLYFIVIGTFVVFGNSPVILAISTLVNTAIAVAINTFPNRKLIGYSYKKQFVDIAPNLILSLIMGFIVYFVNYLPINSQIILLIIQIAVGIFIYVGISILTKNENMKYIIERFNSITKRKRGKLS